MNASQISCFFSLGFFDSTTQRLLLEGTPSEPVGQVFSNISWVRLKKKITSQIIHGHFAKHGHDGNPQFVVYVSSEPAWLPRHCWDQRFFHPGNVQLTAPALPGHGWNPNPDIPACMITRTCRPPSKGQRNGGAVYGSHVPLEIWFDMNFVFCLQRLEHEFQECFRILPRNK